MIVEICLLCTIGTRILKEAVIRLASNPLTIIFVCGFWNDCWCAPAWQWQIGALAVFLSYITLVLVLRVLPNFVGVHVNLLVSIVTKFVELIYLPIILTLAFAIPFYMVFVNDGAAAFVSHA